MSVHGNGDKNPPISHNKSRKRRSDPRISMANCL